MNKEKFEKMGYPGRAFIREKLTRKKVVLTILKTIVFLSCIKCGKDLNHRDGKTVYRVKAVKAVRGIKNRREWRSVKHLDLCKECGESIFK